ncbi:phosphatase PAP2 family protein [Herbiconiux daphne]|uniref:Phosphatase PAP2 family protein n=1 Tax=Herbiconiux daphne TaxID=2970914 RepID=A0ABT2H8P2_9MICO|nr:phosphatase PAP2 family protein [Herbiconiux daphne]MCS5736286.1 phosphatase PAP2 family protein [Herbiconiux daphne]
MSDAAHPQPDPQQALPPEPAPKSPETEIGGSAPAPYKVARKWPLISGVIAVLLVVGLGAVVVLRERGLPFEIDTEWMDEIIEHRNPVWEMPSLVMNYLGGGFVAIWVVPLIVIVLLLIFRRPWAALYFTIAIILSAAAVQILKTAVGRPRPEDMLVVSDFGSFPSGHSANAATLAVTLGIIFVRVWIWVAGSVYTLLMMASRTYLGAHWLTDTIGGLLLGAGIAALLWAPFAAKLYRERAAVHRPVWMRSVAASDTDNVKP